MRSGRRVLFSITAMIIATLFSGAMAAPAVAATGTTTGVGTTSSSQSLLGVHVGNLLGIDVLTDKGAAVTQSPLSALAQITGVRISSSLLGIDQSFPTVVASLPGGLASDSKSLSVDDILGSIGGAPAALLTGGLLPLNVAAVLGDNAAAANGSASVVDLGVLAGLLNVNSVTSALNHASETAAASVTRSLDVDALGVLNLSALLNLLGIDLTNLTLDQITGLISGLGIPVAGIAPGSTLTEELTGLVDNLTDLLDLTVDQLIDPVQDILSNLLGGLPGGDTVVGSIDNLDVTALIDQVTALIMGLLENVLDGLGNFQLLNLNAITTSATAVAKNTLDTSSATASCSLGSVKVGNLASIPLSAVTNALQVLGNTLTSVLGALPLGLGDLVNLSVCGTAVLGSGGNTGLDHNVTASGNTVTATSSASAIKLSINPSAVLDALDLTNSLGSLLNLPLLNGSTLRHGRAVSQADPLFGILTNGLSVEVATVQAAATHVVSTTPETPTVEIPARTGGNATPALLFGALLVPVAIAVRRLTARASTV